MEFLEKLGLQASNLGTSTGTSWFGNENNEVIQSYSPVDGKLIGSLTETSKEEYEAVIAEAKKAYKVWAKMPAPQRGDIVRQYGEILRE